MRDSGLKATLLMTALGVGGCAGGGGLELEGPAAQQIFQQYSGTWELDADRSDDPAQLLAAAAQEQRDGRGSWGVGGRGGGRDGGGGDGRGGDGGFPGAGDGGAFPGGGGDRGGPGGGGISPEAMQMGMALASDVAARLQLRLDSMSVHVIPSGGAGYTLDTNGEASEQELLDGSVLERRVRWEGSELTIRQEIGGFSVKERYEVAADGREMVVLRSIDNPRGADIEARLVYTREVR